MTNKKIVKYTFRKPHTVACPLHDTFAVCGQTPLEAAARELFNLLKRFEERIEDCPDCEATGKEGPEDACGRCGGQGKVLECGTGFISELEDAIAKAEGK